MAAPVVLVLGEPQTITMNASAKKVRAITVPAGTRHLRTSSTAALYWQVTDALADAADWTETDTELIPAGRWDNVLPGFRGTHGNGDVLAVDTTFYFVNDTTSQKASFVALQE